MPRSQYSYGHARSSRSGCRVHTNGINMKKQARGLGKRVEAIVHCSMGCLAQKLEPLGGEKMGHYDISRLLCLAQVLEEVEKKKKNNRGQA